MQRECIVTYHKKLVDGTIKEYTRPRKYTVKDSYKEMTDALKNQIIEYKKLGLSAPAISKLTDISAYRVRQL